MSKHTHDDEEEPGRRVRPRVMDRPLPEGLGSLPDDMLVNVLTELSSEVELDRAWRVNQRMRDLIDMPRHAIRIWDAFEQRFLRGPLALGPAPAGGPSPSHARFNVLLDQYVVAPLSAFIHRTLINDVFAMNNLPFQYDPVELLVSITIAGGAARTPPMTIVQAMCWTNLSGTAYYPGMTGRRYHYFTISRRPALLDDIRLDDVNYGMNNTLGRPVQGVYPWLAMLVHAYGHDTTVTIRCARVTPLGVHMTTTLSWRTMSVATGMQAQDVEEARDE